MTMSIIKPVTLTDAMLVSSTAPETDYTAWNAATSYTVGTRVLRSVSGVHKNFENLIAGINATLPELASSGATPRWLDLGANNRWAMFDTKVGTVTTLASPLTVVINPGSITGLALLELTGKQAVITVKDAPAGTTVYSKTVSLDGTIISSFYDWFFEDYAQLTDLTLTDLPGQYANCELTVSITGTSGSVGIGVCHFGKVYAIGSTQYNATVGIISYSSKTVDAFGNTTIIKRANSKRNSLKLVTKKSDFNRIYRLLAALDSVPCVYIGTEAQGYEPLIVYGFYRDFSIDVAYFSTHLCNIEIEGLI
jgi:hypothetical protein